MRRPVMQGMLTFLGLAAATAGTPLAGAAPSNAPVAQLPDSVIEATAQELAREIRCPVCRGVSVAESPSAFAREMLSVIQEKVAAGESRTAIRRYFADRYGDWVLLDPERSGIMMSLWLLPAGMFALAAIWLLMQVRSWLATPEGLVPGRSGEPSRAGAGVVEEEPC